MLQYTLIFGLFLLTSGLSLGAAHGNSNADSCQQTLQEIIDHPKSLDLLQQLLEAEKKVAALREENGQIERQSTADARRKEAQLSIHIQRGERNAAIDLYRTIFRSVEYSYLRILQIRDQLQALESQATDDAQLAMGIQDQHFLLSAESRKLLIEFGSNYSEYIRARQKLEKLIDDARSQASRFLDDENSADNTQQIQAEDRKRFADNAEIVLKSLQITSLLSAFPDSGLREEPITVKELHDFFRAEPEAQIANVQSDLTEEQRIRRWAILYPAIEAFRFLVYRLPIWAVRPTSMAMGISYNHYVREKYFPDIERLVRYSAGQGKPIDFLYEELAKINSKFHIIRQDEFLVTLARIKDATKLWIDLKAEAKRLSNTDPIYAAYYERMITAEGRALKLGDLPLYFEGSNADKKIASAIGIVTGSAGVYALWGADLAHWVSQVLAMAAGG